MFKKPSKTYRDDQPIEENFARNQFRSPRKDSSSGFLEPGNSNSLLNMQPASGQNGTLTHIESKNFDEISSIQLQTSQSAVELHQNGHHILQKSHSDRDPEVFQRQKAEADQPQLLK